MIPSKVSKSVKGICVSCGCSLTGKNRDLAFCLCENCSKTKEVVLGLGCSTVIVKGTCVGCGCVLTGMNRSFDSHMCKNCFMVESADIEAEDKAEDSSFLDTENFAKFLGCGFYEAQDLMGEFVKYSLVKVEERLSVFFKCSVIEVRERLSVFFKCPLDKVEECLAVFLGR
ncbi:MAG: hypothetical protein ABSA79_07355 [Candidatus Bathyarchaeia archaeon]|jgi:hypothetical protein